MTEAVDGALRDRLEAINARYRAERDKRLRPDGPDQYSGLVGTFEDFDRDPYADPNFTREPVNETVEVAIIGGGIGGLMAAARLAERGITDVRIFTTRRCSRRWSKTCTGRMQPAAGALSPVVATLCWRGF